MAIIKTCWEKANEVNIEAYSIEDNRDIHFNVYNVQDGIAIDYATGESILAK